MTKPIAEGFTEAVDAAKEFYELYKRTVVSGCIPMEQLHFVAALKVFDSMLNAAPQPDAQPVGKFAKFTDGIWREVTAGSAGVPLYTHPEPDDTALFNELLNLLGPTAPSCCGCSAEWQAAIDLIKTRLGVEK